MDDRDLDDAELWAVIDSAAASRSRKPLLALKNSNSMSPGPSPTPLKPSRNPRAHLLAVEEVRAPADGEVVQEEHWAHCRPPKMARLVDPVASNDHRMVVVRHPSRTPSPSSGVVKELSPVVESPPLRDRWQSEETENLNHSLFGKFPSVSSFKQYQNAAMAILEKTDYVLISGSPYIKKSGWRKISFFFNLSFEIKDKSIEFDENRNVQRAEGGRFSDGWGSCERREKRFLKPNHDIPSTAETRAKNKASQDLLGIGEYRPGVINGFRNQHFAVWRSMHQLVFACKFSAVGQLKSTGSFFHDRSITLGSLMGIKSILELSSRSLRRSRKQDTSRGKRSHTNRTWFSLCTKAQLKSEETGNAPSLGHFLEVERRAGNAHGRNRNPITYELDGLPENQSNAAPNSLFANGLIVPPQVDGNGALVLIADVTKSNSSRGLSHDNGYCFALMFPCWNLSVMKAL
ncbi:putative E3 ubiquitin-protein ligase TTC3 [Cocos nucifera]|uniref:Putative E3 ubiquitin-protein ligase TTC3 n=1 Tax=Cocos nucifera TaxID=13894 RepID=A0A8K0I7T6_COCNU|nr:putative E3 ubiquitin-protein ligase TTC3 [Cocos nucifera]